MLSESGNYIDEIVQVRQCDTGMELWKRLKRRRQSMYLEIDGISILVANLPGGGVDDNNITGSCWLR